MRGRWYGGFFWPVLLWGCVVLAAYWPHVGSGLDAPASIPQRMVWASFLVVLAAIPVLSVVFPLGRPGYVFVVSTVVLALSLGLAVRLNGGLPRLPWNSGHYRWLAVWALMTPTLAWVSIAAVARSLTRGCSLATRLITVGGLYLLAIMVIAAYLPPLRELYFLLLSYTTLLFTYFEGRTGGLFFPHETYHLTLAVSLGVSVAAWCCMGLRMWTRRSVRRERRVGR